MECGELHITFVRGIDFYSKFRDRLQNFVLYPTDEVPF